MKLRLKQRIAAADAAGEYVYVTSPYYPGVQIPVTLTDSIYWAHQPVPVQALRDSQAPFPLAQTLAKAGYIIDVPIMVNGWDPVGCMGQRTIDGYTWVPSALQDNIPVGPGVAWPGPPYDPNNPPPGSIKVSVNAADYPPVVPVPPTPVAATNIVGPLVDSVNGIYEAGPGAMINSLTPAVSDGQVILENGVEYLAHVTMGLMGIDIQFKVYTTGMTVQNTTWD